MTLLELELRRLYALAPDLEDPDAVVQAAAARRARLERKIAELESELEDLEYQLADAIAAESDPASTAIGKHEGSIEQLVTVVALGRQYGQPLPPSVESAWTAALANGHTTEGEIAPYRYEEPR